MANSNASVLIPAWKYYALTTTVSSSNDQLTFRDSAGVDITVTLASGTYTFTGLAYEAKKKMAAAGVAAYTVRYRPNTRLFYFASDLGGGATAFQVRVGATANDASALFGITSSKTGASSYDGDTTVPSLTTLTCTQRIRSPKVRPSYAREDLILDGGASESSMFGTTKVLTFFLENESVATIQGIYDMLDAAGGRGQPVRLYPDSTNTTDYVDVVFSDKDFDLPEETDLGLYRHYSFACALRIAVPNTGTIDFRSFLDRRPNS